MLRTFAVALLTLVGLTACTQEPTVQTGTVVIHFDPPQAMSEMGFILAREGHDRGRGNWSESTSCTPTGTTCEGSTLQLNLPAGDYNLSISAGRPRPAHPAWVAVGNATPRLPPGSASALVSVTTGQALEITAHFRPAFEATADYFSANSTTTASLRMHGVVADTPFRASELTARCNQPNSASLYTYLEATDFGLTSAPVEVPLYYTSGFSYFASNDGVSCRFDGLDEFGHPFKVTFLDS